MSLVMVVDDMAVIREPIAASLRAAGFQTLCAGGGEEALAALRTASPDLVLLDLSMPGMDGLTVLRTLRNNPATAGVPVILLTASSDKQDVLQAAKLGVRDYLLKSRFSLPELIARVRKYAQSPKAADPAKASVPARASAAPAASSPVAAPAAVAPARTAPVEIPSLLNREQCVQRAEHALQARTLSGVVAQVISLAASPRGDLSDLANLIARDPVLSARILQAANSVSYASTRGVVSTVQEAVRNIGCGTVRDIAATLGVFDAMPPCSPDGFNPIRCWQHSFAVATLCYRLAPEAETGAAYLVGLCHDLGEILFHTHFATEYRQVLEMQEASGKRRDEVERVMLGMTHGELVETILRRLGLPDAIRQPIEEYHSSGVVARGGSGLARLLRLADLYANGVMLASSGQSPVSPITRADARTATSQENPQRPDAAALRGEIFALTAMLARLSPREEAEVLAVPYPHRPIRVFLARDSAHSSFDPIMAALESLADVTVRESLPSQEEAAAYEALVVTARSTAATGFTGPELAKVAGRPGAAPLPVLWLTGRVEGGPLAVGPTVPASWPIPLTRLAEFVQSITPVVPAQAA